MNLATEQTSLLLQNVHNSGVDKRIQQSMLAIILNAVYLGMNQQMTATVESISVALHDSTATDESFKPSDEVAMHRICGWALKSASDHLRTQALQYKHVIAYSKQLELVNDLKLPTVDKHLLPKPVQYLDRGGLTFLKPILWPWMMAIEERMIEHLNEKCYRVYGSKVFEVIQPSICSRQPL